METTMKAWQANSILDTLEDYLEVPTLSEDLSDINEILDDRDFFEYSKKVDVISSNPPYSMLDRVFNKTLKLKQEKRLFKCQMKKIPIELFTN